MEKGIAVLKSLLENFIYVYYLEAFSHVSGCLLTRILQASSIRVSKISNLPQCLSFS